MHGIRSTKYHAIFIYIRNVSIELKYFDIECWLWLCLYKMNVLERIWHTKQTETLSIYDTIHIWNVFFPSLFFSFAHTILSIPYMRVPSVQSSRYCGIMFFVCLSTCFIRGGISRIGTSVFDKRVGECASS